MTRTAGKRGVRDSEQGYMLVSVVCLLALFVIALAVAVPKVTESIQRDRDVETMHRGKQYIRAIQLYYRKFHAYPPNIDALVKTNDIRFLRKKYVDPTTKKEEWTPIAFGQNKQPIVFGFFGQPMGGSSIAGTGPSGGNMQPGGLNGGLNNGQPGQPGQSGLFNNSSSNGSGIGSSSSGLFSNSSSNSGSGSGIFSNSSGNGSPSGVGGAGTGSPDGSGGTGGPGSGGSSSGFGSGQTFGGAGIIGFSPGSAKKAILVYKKKEHYNEWEFTYDPMMEQMMMGGGNAGQTGLPGMNPNQPGGLPPLGGTPTGGVGTPPTGTPPPITTPQQ